MTFSLDWNNDRYLKYIVDNKLDLIWTNFCNPKSGGIRTSAYNPLFPEDGNVSVFELPCKRKGCSGTWVVPLEDRVRRVIYKVRCNGTVNGSACGGYKPIFYRWRSRNDKQKLYFDNPETVRVYGKLGRAFYATSMVYDKNIVSPKSMYVNEKLAVGATLTIDIDIKRGNICDAVNKENLDLAL